MSYRLVVLLVSWGAWGPLAGQCDSAFATHFFFHLSLRLATWSAAHVWRQLVMVCKVLSSLHEQSAHFGSSVLHRVYSMGEESEQSGRTVITLWFNCLYSLQRVSGGLLFGSLCYSSSGACGICVNLKCFPTQS